MNQNVNLYEAQGSTLKQNRCFPNTKTPFTLQAPRLQSNYKTLHMLHTVYLKYTHKIAQPNTQFVQFRHMAKHLSMSSRRETAKINTFK